ncbi:MAG: hypothetical protein Q9209_001269 [Squamulea sp. 1 TL-2023]
MSHIVKLSDGLDSPKTLPPSKETPFPHSAKRKAWDSSSSTTPSLPPAMDSVRSHTADDIVQMMKRMPLFMTNLDEAAGADGEDNEENIELEALRALQYEGTRAEVALGFKERGNEMVAEKRWKDAKEFYTKGIVALKHVPNDGGSSDGSIEEREKEKKIEEACYVNRALCNLELSTAPLSCLHSAPSYLAFRACLKTNTNLGNYRFTLNDTAHVLTLQPANAKAHYRSSLALFALSKLDLAFDTCDRGLALTSPTLTSTNIATKPSSEHLAFRTLKEKIVKAKEESDAKEKRRISAEERKKKEQLTLSAAITARGIKVRWTAKPPDMEDAKIHLEPDPISPTSQIYFPVLMLYPTHGESDFVKSVAETETFAELLRTVLGERMPWDVEGEYILDGTGWDVFMETATGGMIKIGRKMRLLDVLAEGKVEVVDGVVRVYVVPRHRVDRWIEEMKARKPAA